ncbi:MAG TPA: hypothetical protein VJX10_13020 [Pseudonocardiaceae bacterium]|nr:hypothetical protein [Pseudonocardiaceae bacterium]
MRMRKRRRPVPREPEERRDMVSAELDALFGPSRKHIHERKEWVAVAKVDDHEAGAGPIDLDSGVVQLRGARAAEPTN